MHCWSGLRTCAHARFRFVSAGGSRSALRNRLVHPSPFFVHSLLSGSLLGFFPLTSLSFLLHFAFLSGFFDPEFLDFLESLLLLAGFLVLLLLEHDLTLVAGFVVAPVLLLNVALALFALLRFSSARFHVVDPPFDGENLLAILARPRLHVAPFFVVPELSLGGGERTVFAIYRLMGLLFVLFAVRLGDHFAALATLVVVAGASNIVHAEFAHGDRPFASAADLGLLLLCYFHHPEIFFKLQC